MSNATGMGKQTVIHLFDIKLNNHYSYSYEDKAITWKMLVPLN